MNSNSLSSDGVKSYVKPEMEVLEVAIEGTSIICASATGGGEDVINEVGEI